MPTANLADIEQDNTPPPYLAGPQDQPTQQPADPNIPPLLARPEAPPNSASLDDVSTDHDTLQADAINHLAKYNAGDPSINEQDAGMFKGIAKAADDYKKALNNEITAADNTPGFIRAGKSLIGGVKDLAGKAAGFLNWGDKPEDWADFGKVIPTSPQDVKDLGTGAAEIAQGAVTGVGKMPAVAANLVAGINELSPYQAAMELIPSPLQDTAQKNAAMSRAVGDVLEHYSNTGANDISRITGISHDTANAMIGENLAYMLLGPMGMEGTAEGVANGVRNATNAVGNVTGGAKWLAAKAAPTAVGLAKAATVDVALRKVGLAGGMNELVSTIAGFGGRSGAKNPEIANKVVQLFTDKTLPEITDAAAQQATKPLGMSKNQFFADALNQKAGTLQEAIDADLADMDDVSARRAKDLASDGSFKHPIEDLDKDGQAVRSKMQQVQELQGQANTILQRNTYQKLYDSAVQGFGNFMAHTAQGAAIGAGFAGANSVTGDSDKAVASGLAIGGLLGAGAAPFASLSGTRALRISDAAKDLKDWAVKNNAIAGDMSDLSAGQKRNAYSVAGMINKLGGNKVYLHPEDEMVSFGNQAPDSQPGSGFVDAQGNLHLNKADLPSGVSGHEYTHFTQQFQGLLGEMLSKASPDRMEDFEKQYQDALATTGKTSFNSRKERDAEVGRLVLQHTPIELFYGGETGADVLGRMWDGLMGQGKTKFINGFNAPYTRADILAIKQRFYKAGELAKMGNGQIPRDAKPPDVSFSDFTDAQAEKFHRAVEFNQQQGMSPEAAFKDVADNIEFMPKPRPGQTRAEALDESWEKYYAKVQEDNAKRGPQEQDYNTKPPKPKWYDPTTFQDDARMRSLLPPKQRPELEPYIPKRKPFREIYGWMEPDLSYLENKGSDIHAETLSREFFGDPDYRDRSIQEQLNPSSKTQYGYGNTMENMYREGWKRGYARLRTANKTLYVNVNKDFNIEPMKEALIKMGEDHGVDKIQMDYDNGPSPVIWKNPIETPEQKAGSVYGFRDADASYMPRKPGQSKTDAAQEAWERYYALVQKQNESNEAGEKMPSQLALTRKQKKLERATEAERVAAEAQRQKERNEAVARVRAANKANGKPQAIYGWLKPNDEFLENKSSDIHADTIAKELNPDYNYNQWKHRDDQNRYTDGNYASIYGSMRGAYEAGWDKGYVRLRNSGDTLYAHLPVRYGPISESKTKILRDMALDNNMNEVIHDNGTSNSYRLWSNPHPFVDKSNVYMPRIQSAAIQDKETGKMYTGENHTEAYNDYLKDGHPIPKGRFIPYWDNPRTREGFVDDQGNFHDRANAWDIAKNAGQITPAKINASNQPFGRKTLLSEDLRYMPKVEDKSGFVDDNLNPILGKPTGFLDEDGNAITSKPTGFVDANGRPKKVTGFLSSSDFMPRLTKRQMQAMDKADRDYDVVAAQNEARDQDKPMPSKLSVIRRKNKLERATQAERDEANRQAVQARIDAILKRPKEDTPKQVYGWLKPNGEFMENDNGDLHADSISYELNPDKPNHSYEEIYGNMTKAYEAGWRNKYLRLTSLGRKMFVHYPAEFGDIPKAQLANLEKIAMSHNMDTITHDNESREKTLWESPKKFEDDGMESAYDFNSWMPRQRDMNDKNFKEPFFVEKHGGVFAVVDRRKPNTVGFISPDIKAAQHNAYWMNETERPKTSASGLWDSTFVEGEGAKERKDVAKQLGVQEDKHYWEQKPEARAKIKDYYTKQGADFMPKPKDDYRGYIMRTPLTQQVEAGTGVGEFPIYAASRKFFDWSGKTPANQQGHQYFAPMQRPQQNLTFLNPKIIIDPRRSGGFPYIRPLAKEAQAQGHDGLIIIEKNSVVPADADKKGLSAYPEQQEAFNKDDKGFIQWIKDNPEKVDWENPRNVYIPLEGEQAKLSPQATDEQVMDDASSGRSTNWQGQIKETTDQSPEDTAGEEWKQDNPPPGWNPKEGGSGFWPREFMPRLRAAAVKDKDTGNVFEGQNHIQAKTAWLAGDGKNHNYFKGLPNIETGFTTDDGRFVNRLEGRNIGRDAKQLKPGAYRWKDLISEDVNFMPRMGVPVNTEKWKRTFDELNQGGEDYPAPVVSPAILDLKDGTKWVGKNHVEAYTSWGAGQDPHKPLNNSTLLDGFIDTNGDFLNRKQAGARVGETGQMGIEASKVLAQTGLDSQTFDALRSYMPRSKETDLTEHAAKLPDGKIITGASQDEVYGKLRKQRLDPDNIETGFVDGSGKFLNTGEAFHQAITSGQSGMSFMPRVDKQWEKERPLTRKNIAMLMGWPREEGLKPFAELSPDKQKQIAGYYGPKPGTREDTFFMPKSNNPKAPAAWSVKDWEDNGKPKSIIVAPATASIYDTGLNEHRDVRAAIRDAGVNGTLVRAVVNDRDNKLNVEPYSASGEVSDSDMKNLNDLATEMGLDGAVNTEFKRAGGPSAIQQARIYTYMPPIRKAEARGNSREVSQEEYDHLATSGAAQLNALRQDTQSTEGLRQNWNDMLNQVYAETRKPWGGATINPATGRDIKLTSGRDVGPFAMSVKDEGQDTISVPIDAPQKEFNAAMLKARHAFPQLNGRDHYLGVFRDDDKGTIDIDPVLVVDTPSQVERIGAFTHAAGGAYDYATGNGYFPPHLDYMPRTKPELKKFQDEMAQNYPEAIKPTFQKDKEGNFKVDKDTGEFVPETREYNLDKTPLYKLATQGIKDPIQKDQAYVKALAQKIANEYKQNWSQDPLAMTAKGWYSDLYKLISDKLGKDNAELFAQLLATTSPGNFASNNFRFALEAMNGYLSGRYDNVLKEFKTAHDAFVKGDLKDSSGNPITKVGQFNQYLRDNNILALQASGKKLGKHSLGATYALAGHFWEKQTGKKVTAFVKNISGTDLNNPTIDTWAARTAHRLSNEDMTGKPWRNLPINEAAIGDRDFDLAQDAYKEAAKMIGVNPTDLQAIAWFAELNYGKNG